MLEFLIMTKNELVIVALSGGVDSAVTALLLRDAGYGVQCLHMSNWEDDGYCEAAQDFQDAREVAEILDLPLHRVNFADEYRSQVFATFLDEYATGRTPNPDVLCNQQIKFGAMRRYAERLGGTQLATGHYARLTPKVDGIHLLKGRDRNKDQSYFLHAVNAQAFTNVLFPLGELTKQEVRERAETAGLPVATKKDSTGICFIGERPFAKFLGEYLPVNPGNIKDSSGRILGEHQGLAYYTIGQRQGLKIGGLTDCGPEPWYVADKIQESNELVVVQGTNNPLLYKNYLTAADSHWINSAPANVGGTIRCRAKTRYRQADQTCAVTIKDSNSLQVCFDEPQRAVTPGQYVVFYQQDHCLGGAMIQTATMQTELLSATD